MIQGVIYSFYILFQYCDIYLEFLNKNNNNIETDNLNEELLKKEKIPTISTLNKNKENNNLKEELIYKKKLATNSKLKHKKEINNLKEELIKKDKIIKQQKNKIIELENKLKSTNINSNKIQSLEFLIKEKDKEINELKLQLENNKININKNNDKCVNFISQDNKVNYAIPCSGYSIFAQIEELLYNEYPEYRETNNIFQLMEKKFFVLKQLMKIMLEQEDLSC